MRNRGISRDTFWMLYKASKYGKKQGNSPRDFAKLCYYKGKITWSEEKKGRPDKVSVDLELVKDPIIQVWSQIGGDIEKATTIPGGPKMTNALCIECCLDQDNLTTYGGKYGWVAEDILSTAIDRFGYEPVLKYLAHNIPLC